ncbi:MAG: BamA/TamA family outer membrane protein [Aquificaceae bacterium]|nr:BamA/TamA family outer membrane protein [Aquificaceae bacterium]
MSLLFFLFLPLVLSAQVTITSNYPLRENNFQRVINRENYSQMLQIIRSLEDVKEVYVREEEGKIRIHVERYPIVRKIRISGNRAVLDEEILSYLGFYEGMPLRNQVESRELEERVKRLYIDKGFLDVSVVVNLTTDPEGYVDLQIRIEEGSVYFTEGGIYKGSSYEPSLLDLKIGLVRGRVFKESLIRESVFSLQDFYLREGFWDSFVYYEGLEKLRLNRPFYQVLLPQNRELRNRPLRVLGALSEGMSNLFSHPFATVRALLGRGYVARPVFQVIEGKRYRILTEGVNFFTQEQVIKLSGLTTKGVDPFSLEEAKENLKKAYHRKGFFDVEVGYRLEGQDIILTVQEGSRYTLVGQEGEGYYDEDLLEALLEKRLGELFQKGYTLAEGKIKKEVLRDSKQVRVSLEIEPGKRQVLKDFVYVGNNSEIKKIFAKHRRGLPTAFDSKLVEALNLDLQRYFLQAGLMEADYRAEVEIGESGESLEYTYIYRVVEGPVYRLGETLYYGYRRTSQRELSYMVEKAKEYSEALNDRALQNLLNSGIFSGVSLETFIDKEKKVVHRLVKVSEDKRGMLDLSLGYDTEENLSLEAFLGAKNLFGVGLNAGIRYKKTGKRELYDLGLQDSFFFSSRYLLKSNLFKVYEEHRSYTLDSYGFNLQLGYRINTTTSVGPVFSFLRNRVDGQLFNLRKQGVFLVREYKDEPFSPKRLHYNSINLSFAQGDARYAKLDLSAFYLLPLKEELKLSFKVALGALRGNPPIFERFFLGGLRDLRGYSFEEVGQPQGGKYYSFGRLELIFPLRGPLLGALFTDVGAVANRREDLTKEVKSDIGTAVGFNTPIGPVRFDLAVPMDRDWLKRAKLHLSVVYYY